MTEELDVNNKLEQNQLEEVKMEASEEVVEETKETAVIEEPAKPIVVTAPRSAYESLKDFDWDSIGKKHEIYDANEKARLEQEYDRTLSSITEHEVIDGTIVAMNNREVVINIGFKSDGVLPLN